ncbi:MAG TPA: IS3 family transposase, partial [Dermatophilaceae bacterium]|nr:IS3 family transposase [Dermatophilaceae bacterium]
MPRSTCHDWSARGHQVSPAAALRAELGVLVMETFDEFLEVYGARRIARVLAERGHPVSPGTVGQLMRAQHLVA